MSDQGNPASSGSAVDARSESSPRDEVVPARHVSSKAGSVSQVGTTVPGTCTPRTVATIEHAPTPPQIHVYSPDQLQHKDEGECSSSRAEPMKRPASRSSIRNFLKEASQSLKSRTTFSSLSSKSSTKSSVHTSNEAPDLPYGPNTSQMIPHSASIYPPEGVHTAGPSNSALSTVENSSLLHLGTEHRPVKNRSPPSPNPQQTHLQIIRYDTDADGTSSRAWYNQTSTRVPSRSRSQLSLGLGQVAPVEASQSLDAAQGSPSTPTSPNDWRDRDRDRDRNLQSEWARWQSQESPWCDEHKVLAKAVALYDWSGAIPSRRTRGFPLKEGCPVDICNILSKAWYQVHYEGKCEYLPSEYVQIIEFSDDASRKLFKKYHKLPNVATNAQDSPESSSPSASPSKPKPTIWESVYYYSMWKKLSRRPPRKKPVVDSHEPPPVVKKRKERPDVPPAPFDREPHDFERNQHRVVVSMKCRPFATGVAITFYVTLIPAPQWRFTTFRFAAELPPGQVIIGIYPQKVLGTSTSLRHNDARKQELAITAKGGYMGAGLELGQTRGSSQEVEYTRKTRVAIVGGGVNSGKATWNATEDVANQTGLESRLELSILLPTAKPPPQLKCYYAAKLGKSTQVFTSNQSVEKFENRCEFSFTS